MDSVQLVLGIISAVLGGTVFWQFIYFRKQNRESKNIDNLKATIDLLQNNINFLSERINVLEKMVTSKDVHISQLSSEKNILEIKKEKLKNAINVALSCKFCGENQCPVLERRAKHDKEYHDSLKLKNDVDSNGE